MKLTLGFSPCPNDCFIFDALVNNKIDTGELRFDVFLEDVETLNEWALSGKLDLTKISYGVLPLLLDTYRVLNSGSALGRGVGPLLISKKEVPENSNAHTLAEIGHQSVAIPGQHTTAHMLFSLAYPDATNKVFLRYHEIEDFVLDGKGLGVIIHENRFTYTEKGLHKVTDLGAYWENKTGKPIPLGAIVAKQGIDEELQVRVNKLIKKSIGYAYENHYQELTDYVKHHAREMSESVMRKHIDLYVNDFSVELGMAGRSAVLELLNIYQLAGKTGEINDKKIFLDIDQY